MGGKRVPTQPMQSQHADATRRRLVLQAAAHARVHALVVPSMPVCGAQHTGLPQCTASAVAPEGPALAAAARESQQIASWPLGRHESVGPPGAPAAAAAAPAAAGGVTGPAAGATLLFGLAEAALSLLG